VSYALEMTINVHDPTLKLFCFSFTQPNVCDVTLSVHVSTPGKLKSLPDHGILWDTTSPMLCQLATRRSSRFECVVFRN
jgi:hypothetical protein